MPDMFPAKDVIHKPFLYKALHYFYNDSRTKNGFPFCGDGFVIDTIPIFYSIIKSRRHTANMTTVL